MIRPELQALLDALDEETRERWRPYLEQVDRDVQELGPSKVGEQLDEALKLLLAVAYTVRLCHSEEEAPHVLDPVRHAAEAIEHARRELREVAKKPEWSH